MRHVSITLASNVNARGTASLRVPMLMRRDHPMTQSLFGCITCRGQMRLGDLAHDDTLVGQEFACEGAQLVIGVATMMESAHETEKVVRVRREIVLTIVSPGRGQ